MQRVDCARSGAQTLRRSDTRILLELGCRRTGSRCVREAGIRGRSGADTCPACERESEKREVVVATAATHRVRSGEGEPLYGRGEEEPRDPGTSSSSSLSSSLSASSSGIPSRQAATSSAHSDFSPPSRPTCSKRCSRMRHRQVRTRSSVGRRGLVGGTRWT